MKNVRHCFGEKIETYEITGSTHEKVLSRTAKFYKAHLDENIGAGVSSITAPEEDPDTGAWVMRLYLSNV